jgi:hypothetical protein
MSWQNFDWLDFELGEYKESLNHRVREAYRAAYAVLEQAYREGKKDADPDIPILKQAKGEYAKLQ